jgi:glucose-1-phosphate cytidylyltransferase
MPIGGVPIIVHLMRIYERQGIRDFILAAGHRQETLRDYFDRRFSEWRVTVVDTGEDSNTGERIRRCEPLLGDTFMATYGDGLGDVDMAELLLFHREHSGLATVTSVPLRSQYGTIELSDSQQVQYFREKPVIPDYWINAGFFVFDKRAFACWDGNDLEGEVLPGLAVRGALYAYKHQGFWKSMDTSKDQMQMEDIYLSGRAPWLRSEWEQAVVHG